MVGCGSYLGVIHDMTDRGAFDGTFGGEEIVQANMRAPGGERQAWLLRLQGTEDIAIARVEDDLNRAPANPPAAQPHERLEAMRQLSNVEQFPWRERVEITSQHVESMLVSFDAFQERTQFLYAASFGPRRVNGAQVHAKDTDPIAFGHDFQKRVARHARVMPFSVKDRQTADKSQRFARTGTADLHAGALSQPFDNGRLGRLLKDDEVRAAGADHRKEGPLAASTSVPDVVGEKAERHSVWGFSISV